MTCTELRNEIYSFQDINNFDVNAFAKENNFPCISRMKKAELIIFLELLEEMQKESEEEVIEETVDVELNKAVIKESIKTTLAAMNATLDNTTWTELYQRYLHLKSELERLEAVG